MQETLFASIQNDPETKRRREIRERIDDHFRLLQACDNLSLLSCVDYQKPATLLHPLRLKDGGVEPVVVESLGERYFCLTPYPFDISPVTREFPARHVEGKIFASAEALQEQFADAEVDDAQGDHHRIEGLHENENGPDVYCLRAVLVASSA